MRKQGLALLAVCALFLMACDVTGIVKQFAGNQDIENLQATVQALATDAPAALASVVPTMAAAIPTKAVAAGTPAAPTKAVAGGAGGTNPFSQALAQAQGATKYRVQFSWIFGSTDKGKYAEQAFIDFTGEIDGAKSHMTSKGGVLAMLAKDANTPVEIITADGKTYMKGVSMFGMADAKQWYITDGSTTSSFADMAKPDEYKDWVSGSNPADIKKVRTETLDGQSCDVYLYDIKSVQNSSLSALLGAAQDKGDFSAIDKGEMNFWLCKDNYVHQFVMDYEGHDAKDATQKAALKMKWHGWDFGNAAISVTAPKDAKPLPGS